MSTSTIGALGADGFRTRHKKLVTLTLRLVVQGDRHPDPDLRPTTTGTWLTIVTIWVNPQRRGWPNAFRTSSLPTNRYRPPNANCARPLAVAAMPVVDIRKIRAAQAPARLTIGPVVKKR
jgi:hypothetical protein